MNECSTSDANQIVELLKRRRSIRKFKQQPVDEEKKYQLLKAALYSPTSRNRRPWEFVVITDAAILEELSQARPHGSAFLKGAPLGIVVLGDEEKCDVWTEDTSIAAINIQLAAEAMGLGSCWIQIRKRDHNELLTAEKYVQKLLAIPDTLRVLSIIAIGHPEEQRPPYDEDVLQFEKVHRNQYGK
ncbi:nitroreductase family protein [Desulfuribacillus alkaliarsenatis]|uniref:Nitroreductase domain-containing protein n=1 Tax=Desulfuribacillus alkaliarsenatis TaxID=766136 RepID=A0A1E5G270_9FIRM|nr:nitroreductase family protein [Desulfuribacillus alkaliarsenatis]OEF96629.1 hypothetical protein BHF68_08280 [Desulfuribacillus alkaliarsenatis]